MARDNLKIGLAGLGVVGAALAKRLLSTPHILTQRAGICFELRAVSARSRSKNRGVDVSACDWYDDPVAMACAPDIDVFVELIGGQDGPAYASVTEALKQKKHVVTANKALLAAHGIKLARLAEENGVGLYYEASVAGAIPAIKVIRENLSGNTISRVFGILNGTCNYILTRMEQERAEFETVLADAQRLGYAEAEPGFDIDGFDTAHKLAILSSLSFGTQIAADQIFIEGIRSISLADISAATRMGYRIKLLGVALSKEGGVEQRVHPTMVPIDSAIAQISGIQNAVMVDADLTGQMMLAGPGAGGNATASSVLADIVDIGRVISAPTLGILTKELKPYHKAPMRAHEGGYYLRLELSDEVGTFAHVAGLMAQYEISLKSIMQNPDETGASDKATSTVILITHQTTELKMRDALKQIEASGHCTGSVQMIRIEKF